MGTSPSKMLRSSTVAIRAVGQRACSNVVATVAPFPMPKSNIDKAQHADGQIKTYHEVAYPVPTVGTPCTVFRSDAEARIAAVPIIMVDGDMAYCDGGGGARGHPVENIQLNLKHGGSNYCKYCGLRFEMAHHH